MDYTFFLKHQPTKWKLKQRDVSDARSWTLAGFTEVQVKSFVSGFERLLHYQKMRNWGLTKNGFIFSILVHSLIESFTYFSSYSKFASAKWGCNLY